YGRADRLAARDGVRGACRWRRSPGGCARESRASRQRNRLNAARAVALGQLLRGDAGGVQRKAVPRAAESVAFSACAWSTRGSGSREHAAMPVFTTPIALHTVRHDIAAGSELHDSAPAQP